MANFTLPQNDDKTIRKAQVQEQGKLYSYNRDLGIPLIEAQGPDDHHQADWTLKIFTCLLSLRTNLQKIYDKTGLNFMIPKPVRDIPRFIEVLKTGQDPVDYFTPDPGFVDRGARSKRPSSINEYVDSVFLDRDKNNKGVAALPEIATKWEKDSTFAFTFLAGPNPNQLQRWTAASKPAGFDLSGFDLGSNPNFSGDNIDAAIAAGRVYFVDHSDMRELFANAPGAPAPNASQRSFKKIISEDWKYIYAPNVVFVVPPGGKHMLPVAIQCGLKEEGHRIYTPKDGYSWKMARSCVLAAHNNHHEVISHLGLTHFLIDPIVMATRIRLHTNHPIYKLLNPHFEGTASINRGARTSLILPERSVDRLVGSKIEKNYPYLGKNRLGFSFRQNFPKVRAAARGVDNGALLPNYAYREDSTLLWDAIHNWVSDYVSIWYKSEDDIRADTEIQDWANEINGPGQIKDFCLTGGGVQSRDDLIDMLTMTIFTAGPQHAAVNFSQGTDMVFVPANPLAGYAPAPKGVGHTEQDFLSILPPLDVAVHSWSILNLLAGINVTRLGDYRGAFALHPASEAARLKFWANLKLIEQRINAANQLRRAAYDLAYVHLLPSRVPASINI